MKNVHPQSFFHLRVLLTQNSRSLEPRTSVSDYECTSLYNFNPPSMADKNIDKKKGVRIPNSPLYYHLKCAKALFASAIL